MDIIDRRTYQAKEEAEKAVEKKETNSYRRMTILLAGILIVAFGVLASIFYTYYEAQEAEKINLHKMLENAQLENESLAEENARLQKEEEELVEVIARVEEEASLLEIPFSVNLDDWKYLLVNELHPLTQDFEPQLVQTRNGQRVDRRIKAELEAMIDAAKEEGMNLMICSSYRDYKKQDSLMDQSIAKFVRQGMDYRDAFFKTKEQIALTGASEHHTGLAVDIVGKNHQSLDSSQADTKEAQWLYEHAHEYGFILRYPADKEEQTMISFESWHFRYVGKQAAAFMKENNLCLEEFVELVQAHNEREESGQARLGGSSAES